MNLKEKEKLITKAIPSIYQCIFEKDLANKTSAMSMAVASLVFEIYKDPDMRNKSMLNDIFIRLKNIYIS